jgi:Ca-activated chloride channel family protein
MKLIYLILFMVSFASIAQLETSNLTHDFGEMYDNAPSYHDFRFKNNSGVAVFLLTLDKPREVNYIHTKKIIQPDSTMLLRLKIDDRIQGRFKYKVDLFFSDSNTPITVTLMGNVKQKSTNQLTDCPDFNAPRPTNGLAQFEVTIKVVDSLTGDPIKKSKVYLINGNQLVGEYFTNAYGIIHKSIPLGYYFITAHKRSYFSNSHEGYINYDNNYVEIALGQPQKVEPVIIPTHNPVLVVNEPVQNVEINDSIATTIEPEPEVVIVPEPEIIVVVEEPELVNEPIDDKPTQTEFDNLPPDNFDDNYYLPNNIVFIVDVSTSMKYKGRIDLLKKSMIELTQSLRPQDHVSLISYSSDYTILLEDVSGANKAEIINKVNSVKVSGFTDGGEAIKQAYLLVNKSYIEGGNNQIFMVTDGAFNRGQTKYKRVIKKNYAKSDIKFTMVGIKTTNSLDVSMTEMAKFGGGKYLKIMNDKDADDKLLEEIKRTSAIEIKN